MLSLIRFLKAGISIICLHHHLSEHLNLVLFVGVFSYFQWTGQLFRLFLSFIQGFHTSSSSTLATWGFSCVKLFGWFLRTVIFWSHSFKGLLYRLISLYTQCHNIWIATVNQSKSSGRFWKGQNMLRKFELKQNFTSHDYFNWPT